MVLKVDWFEIAPEWEQALIAAWGGPTSPSPSPFPHYYLDVPDALVGSLGALRDYLEYYLDPWVAETFKPWVRRSGDSIEVALVATSWDEVAAQVGLPEGTSPLEISREVLGLNHPDCLQRFASVLSSMDWNWYIYEF